MGEGRIEEIIRFGCYCISVAGKPVGVEAHLRYHANNSMEQNDDHAEGERVNDQNRMETLRRDRKRFFWKIAGELLFCDAFKAIAREEVDSSV
jgi:hypothetical protein